MCGITGIFDSSLSSNEIRPSLKRMNDTIYHRGPDDEGFFIENGLGLAMRRLSIIDLSSGTQPIFSEDGNVVIVFNGEIYNYRELTEQLTKRGHTFKTASDTEVIVHLYEDHGEDCVDHLRGMFAFAIWDKRRRKLFIARDRLGIKPLYYAHFNNRLIFGSEIKSILQHHSVEASLNTEALGHFISLKYVPAPLTMFEGIHSLPPGHALTYDDDELKVRSYWDLRYTQNQNGYRREETYTEQLEELLHESVKLRMRSDVPFGAFLSGGVDSSTIVALMSRYLNEPVKTFSVGFKGEGRSYSELKYARLVSQRYGTDHYDVYIDSQDFIDLSEKVVWHLDQPIADEAVLANYMVSELASQHVKMVLTGEGGDELFAGYARYAGEKLYSLFKPIPAPIKSLALLISKRIPKLRREKLALYALCQSDDVARILNWFPLFNSEMKSALLSAETKTAANGSSAYNVFADQLARTDANDPLSRMQYIDTKLWLPDDLLARGDKTSMAASLEARVPLLDHKLVEFAASLPPHLKMKGLTRKYLLKKVSRKWLPDEIIDRKKEGFPIPIAVWFRNQARSFLRDHLSPDTIRRRGLFDPDYVEKLLVEHESGFAVHSSPLWGLLSVELWHRQFIDSKSNNERLNRKPRRQNDPKTDQILS